MPFYVRLGPHGLIIAIGAFLHTRLGVMVYRVKRRRFHSIRGLSETHRSKTWMSDSPSSLTPSKPLVQIVRENYQPGRVSVVNDGDR
ncbi:MAG: hypothetical protein RJA81_477 [Planctomycetota bacterium]|jgi:hypothetical protein